MTRYIVLLLMASACSHVRPMPKNTIRVHLMSHDELLMVSVLKADERFDAGDFRAAIKFQRVVVMTDPDTATRWWRLAQMYRAAGEMRHASWVMRSFARRAQTHPLRAEAERLASDWAQQTSCSAVDDEMEEPEPTLTVTTSANGHQAMSAP